MVFDLDLIYNDNYFLVLNKPPGLTVQRDKTESLSLQEILRQKLRLTKSCFLEAVHRLDRPVSGLVIFAKNKEVFQRLSLLFAQRQVKKIYWAVVEAKPPQSEAILENYLVTNKRYNKSYAHPVSSLHPANASLSYFLCGQSERYYFLIIELFTGKQHQIRAQLSACGCPIKGDVKYGAKRSNPDRSIMLHAAGLAFSHPLTGNPLAFKALPPANILWDIFLTKSAHCLNIDKIGTTLQNGIIRG